MSSRAQRYGVLTPEPIVQFLADGRLARIYAKPLLYVPPLRVRLPLIVIPVGFVCDGASIPRCLWPLAGGPFEGKHRDAALLHDWLYWNARQGHPLCTREEADYVFFLAMRLRRCHSPNAYSKWLAVRIGSRAGWQHVAQAA